eukprot:scaffold4733_cov170-Alexandrium_tamarense.AAC.33
MSAWANDLGVDNYEAGNDKGRLTFLGDPEGVLTRKLEMEMTHPGPISVGIIGRLNGEVKYVAVSEAEDDPAGDENPEKTLAPAILDAIVGLKDEL